MHLPRPPHGPGAASRPLAILAALGSLLLVAGFQTPSPEPSRARSDVGPWQGHDWVFVFSTDDGLRHNLGWAEVADSLDFAFTVYVNQHVSETAGWAGCYIADRDELRSLAEQGLEIGQHGYEHGRWGLAPGEGCPSPASFINYWYPECYPDGMTTQEAFECFLVEVSRDSLRDWLDVEALTAAYPRHLHTDSVMYHLERLGYQGARDGGGCWQSPSFDVPPLNSWDGGLSLYRMPTLTTTATLWGDHWDQDGHEPQHFCTTTFRAKFDSVLAANQVIDDHKMFCLYTHDFGADDDTYCDCNWHHGGLTPAELAETVSYARQRGAIVMTFAEACAWYRSHAERIDDPVAEFGPGYAGDLVWRALPWTAAPAPPPVVHLEQNRPNPFNPRTEISFTISRPADVRLYIHDAAGRRIAQLRPGHLAAGRHAVTWNGRDDRGRAQPSGVYSCRLEASGEQRTMKMTLLR